MSKRDLEQQLRRTRPDDPEQAERWATSEAGQRILDRVLASDPSESASVDTRRRPSWRTFVLVPVVAAIAVTAGGFGWNLVRTGSILPDGNGRVEMTYASHTFDVFDLGTVMREAEAVYVGRVVDKADTDNEVGSTYYRTTVLEVVKGRPGSEHVVEQYGYIDWLGTTHKWRGQPMFEVGKTYLMAVNLESVDKPGFVLPGPLAIREITSPEQRAELVAKYREAAE